MKLSDFDFELPPERIAQQPVEPRDASRLLVVPPRGSFLDATVAGLPDFLRAGDLLVFNNTRVIPARLWGQRGEAMVEITLHRWMEKGLWEAFAKRSKRLKPEDELIFGEGFTAKVLERHADGRVLLAFTDPENLFTHLERYGQMPLPPYIKRKEKQEADSKSYQTVYAEAAGAVAAPTAGLHFSDALFAALDAKEIERCFVTLHVGGGTFLPVKTENIHEHVMHHEWMEVTEEAAQQINTAKAEGRRVIAIGTTSLRTLESASDDHGRIQPMRRDTNIFITPGYRFKMVDALFTNFHLPKSTLFMLVSAFCGQARMQQAYRHAIETEYRFFSYGDACLLERAEGVE